jgi:hypothetical protein
VVCPIGWKLLKKWIVAVGSDNSSPSPTLSTSLQNQRVPKKDYLYIKLVKRNTCGSSADTKKKLEHIVS